MLEKGIEVSNLLASQVFTFEIDYSEWPMSHCDDTTMIVPYNGSLFHLRKSYEDLFKLDEKEKKKEEKEKEKKEHEKDEH